MPSGDTQSATVSNVDVEDRRDINKFIKNLYNVVKYDIPTEGDVQKFTEIINFYQEQPYVLDPYLQEWIDALLKVGLSKDVSRLAMDLAFKYLYLFTKVRGQKYVVRLLPHEVADIDIVLSMLDSDKSEIWHARYMLFLWMSILVLIPFDLKKLDGDKDEGWYVRKMLSIALKNVAGADKSSEAAALVIAKLVTRPDLHEEHLKQTFEVLINECIKADNDAVFGSRKKIGRLTTICRIYKLGRREYILGSSPLILEKLLSMGLQVNQNTLLRKFEVKLAQRIGLSFLAPRIAKWRYSRGTRLLADSFSNKVMDTAGDVSYPANSDAEDGEEDYEIPDEIEEIFEILFKGLRDPETIVRWSAAKGIGRITSRLPRSLATDVVNNLLECFSPLETSSSWHGGCLALAELGRHGFLLPEHLPLVVPILVDALQYDEKRGNLVLGANVRDAACYISWSFARTYEPVEIAPFVHKIASALILASLFDRAIGVRRAASAAFQENVGRQGSFPFGIDIVTTCDYYAVALQTNTYHKLALKVASFDPYSKPIIDHLATVKVKHWCPTIRRDAGIAIGLLCSQHADYISKEVLPDLLESLETGDFNCRHGALHAIGEICLGLKDPLSMIASKDVLRINNVLKVLSKRNSFRGSGGDEMRGAVCYFIEKLSQAEITLGDNTLSSWQEFIDTCLMNPEQTIGLQAMAVKALSHLTLHYYSTNNEELWGGLVDKYSKQLRHEFTATRIGAGLALSVLPKCIMQPQASALIKLLPPCTKVSSKSEISLFDCRVSAVKAISNLYLTCDLNSEARSQIFEVLLACLEDYSTDNRGDIGSFVREAALTCLMKVSKHTISQGHPTINLTLTHSLKQKLVCSFLQQSVEKIDRTRQVALEALHHIVHCGVELDNHSLIKEAVPFLECILDGSMDPTNRVGLTSDVYQDVQQYSNVGVMFPRCMRLLQAPEYIYSLLRGTVVSIGGLTESLVKASSAAFVDYLTDNESMQGTVCDALITVMTEDSKVDRVIVPLLKTVELALTNVVLDGAVGNEFIEKFSPALRVELKGCGNVPKLLASLPPLANLLQFSDNTHILSTIMLLLCHKYPRVRRGMADALYTALLTYDEAVENAEQVSGILESTVWEDPNDISALRAKRNEICELIGVKVPKLLAAGAAKPKPVETVNQFDSYGDLVGRAGY